LEHRNASEKLELLRDHQALVFLENLMKIAYSPSLLLLFLLATISSMPVVAEETSEPPEKPSIDYLTFGIVPQQSASRLASLWVPIFKYLEEVTKKPIHFRTAPDIPTFEKRLAAGDYDFAYMNPYHYTIFSKNPGYKAFAKARGERLKGIIVVRKDSPIKSLNELNGATLAVPAPAAFAASILTRAYLSNVGIQFTAKYVSSHDSVYRTVAKDLYTAGGGVIQTFENVAPEIRDQLHILWTSQGYTPHAFAAHPRVAEGLVKKVVIAMETMDQNATGKALLDAINFKGIEAASDSDWDDVRDLNIQLLDHLDGDDS
jgi:phosphonate transport system substrate-binding protein